MQLWSTLALSLLALSVPVNATPLPPSEAADVDVGVEKRQLFCGTGTGEPNNYCWEGYKSKGFKGTKQSNCIYGLGCCQSLSGWEVTSLFSAKTTKGSKVYLYTGTFCSGKKQVIDTAGYYDMSSLPAYHSWSPASF